MPAMIYGIIVAVKLRTAIRVKYGIPTGNLGEMEDLCYVLFCNCCVMSQMARQTTDYTFGKASCCSVNGLLVTDSSQIEFDDSIPMALAV